MRMNNMGMNNMGMNNMGMNNMGMSNMGMNNMGMNNMGMNMGMNNMGMNMGMNMPMQQMTNIMNQMNQMFMGQNQGNGQSTQNNNQNVDESNNQNQITLKFIKNNQNQSKRETAVQCLSNEKLSDVVEKYRAKTGDKEQNLKFIHNAKKLNLDLSVSESGLLNNSSIFVMPTEGIVGGR